MYLCTFFSPIIVSLPTEQVDMDSGVSEGIAPFHFFFYFFGSSADQTAENSTFK